MAIRETRKWQQQKTCQGKHKEFGNFVQGKTLGIWYAQVVNSLILKLQDIIAIYAAKCSKFSKSVLFMKLSQISEIGTEQFSSWTGEKQGKHREFFLSFSSILPPMFYIF